MKRLFFFLISIIISCSALAQSDWVEDTAAKGIMDRLAKKYKGVTSILADAIMISENKTENTRDEKKINILLSENKYRIILGNQEVYCDGILVWHYNKDAEEVTLTVAEPNEMGQINLPKIISEWEQQFRSKLIREDKEEESTFQIIDLTPKIRQDYYKIRLTINKDAQEIREIQFSFFEGENIRYIFTTYKTNPKISPNDFSFNTSAHPSVTVIDLR